MFAGEVLAASVACDQAAEEEDEVGNPPKIRYWNAVRCSGREISIPKVEQLGVGLVAGELELIVLRVIPGMKPRIRTK